MEINAYIHNFGLRRIIFLILKATTFSRLLFYTLFLILGTFYIAGLSIHSQPGHHVIILTFLTDISIYNVFYRFFTNVTNFCYEIVGQERRPINSAPVLFDFFLKSKYSVTFCKSFDNS